MQNEGASKGILVTTSGYGRASFEFAQNMPLELLSGSNLLYLLEENAGISARIESPEDWAQPEEQSAGEAQVAQERSTASKVERTGQLGGLPAGSSNAPSDDQGATGPDGPAGDGAASGGGSSSEG